MAGHGDVEFKETKEGRKFSYGLNVRIKPGREIVSCTVVVYIVCL